MIPTSSEVAPALGKDDLRIEQQCQDATSGSECKPVELAEARWRLETKYAACLALDGSNGFPIAVDRIRDPKLRTLAGAGMACRGWSVEELRACTGGLREAASAVIAAAKSRPIWGMEDFLQFGEIERLEAEWRRLEP